MQTCDSKRRIAGECEFYAKRSCCTVTQIFLIIHSLTVAYLRDLLPRIRRLLGLKNLTKNRLDYCLRDFLFYMDFAVPNDLDDLPFLNSQLAYYFTTACLLHLRGLSPPPAIWA